jgi:hypothetical protein
LSKRETKFRTFRNFDIAKPINRRNIEAVSPHQKASTRSATSACACVYIQTIYSANFSYSSNLLEIIFRDL